MCEKTANEIAISFVFDLSENVKWWVLSLFMRFHMIISHKIFLFFFLSLSLSLCALSALLLSLFSVCEWMKWQCEFIDGSLINLTLSLLTKEFYRFIHLTFTTTFVPFNTLCVAHDEVNVFFLSVLSQ